MFSKESSCVGCGIKPCMHCSDYVICTCDICGDDIECLCEEEYDGYEYENQHVCHACAVTLAKEQLRRLTPDDAEYDEDIEKYESAEGEIYTEEDLEDYASEIIGAKGISYEEPEPDYDDYED